MDDGSVKSSQSKGVYFNTQSFPCQMLTDYVMFYKQNLTLMQCQKMKKLKCFHFLHWKRPDSGRYRIYVSGKSYERLRELITPYFTGDMWYKWPSPRKPRQSSK